jgi:hypothetical protein
MTPRQRRGIILILVGLAVPIVALVFTSPRGRAEGLLDQVRASTIVLVQGKGSRESACECEYFPCRPYTEAGRLACLAKYDKDTRSVDSTILPYRYIFAVGVITIFTGVGLILLGQLGES